MNHRDELSPGCALIVTGIIVCVVLAIKLGFLALAAWVISKAIGWP